MAGLDEAGVHGANGDLVHAAALDGEVPLERLWLQRAAPLLDRRSRIERVISLLTDEQAAPELRRAAFETLAKAQVVDARVLDPRTTWSDPAAYDRKRRELAAMFRENFRQYEPEVPPAVAAAGPAAG